MCIRMLVGPILRPILDFAIARAAEKYQVPSLLVHAHGFICSTWADARLKLPA